MGLDADIGYVHTGFEKNFEQKTYWKGIPYAPRMDYVAFFANELAYVGAVERLIDIEVPPRAQWIRTLFAELNRIHSHLIYLGTSAVEMGALSVFFYCLRERDSVLDLFEMATGVRMHDRYPQFGGVAEDLPKGFYAECRRFCAEMPKRIDEYLDLLAGNPVWKSATRGSAPSPARRRSRWASRARTCGRRASPTTSAARSPYWPTDQLQFDVITREGGDAYDRFMCRTLEMYESAKLVEQMPRLDAGRPGHGRRPQVRAPAPARAAHVDGVADPPLQARDRGLPGAARPGVPPGGVAPRGVRLLPGLRRRADSLGAPTSARRAS